MTSIANDLRLKPQTKMILSHLTKRGSISPIEAWGTYGNTRLAAAIHDLRRVGYRIETNIKRDEVGHTYARYMMRAA